MNFLNLIWLHHTFNQKTHFLKFQTKKKNIQLAVHHINISKSYYHSFLLSKSPLSCGQSPYCKFLLFWKYWNEAILRSILLPERVIVIDLITFISVYDGSLSNFRGYIHFSNIFISEIGIIKNFFTSLIILKVKFI